MLAEKQYPCVLLHEFTVRQENKKIQNESYVEIFPQNIIKEKYKVKCIH